MLAGALLAADELRQFAQYISYSANFVWLGWVPELALSVSLVLAVIWFVSRPLQRIAILLFVASLLIHALDGLFIRDPWTGEILVVVLHCLSVLGCVASGVLAFRHRIFSPVATVLFAIWMFALALVGVVDLASILDSVVHGFPFGSLEPAGDMFRLFDLLRAWLFDVVEILVGFLQIATGLVLVRTVRPSPPAASLSL